LITAEGFLEGFPFAALSSDETRYSPLVLDFDLASLRCAAPPIVTTDGAGVVVADPELPADLRRRYPDLVRLRDGSAEAAEVARCSPGATILSGRAATKAALVRRWQEAGFLHFASHVVRDPEDPYLTFIPLADGGSSVPHVSRLEIADIREADLSHCPLVVLSSCTSGRAVALGPSFAAPSLADAFADAGAHAVVQTFWRVRDREAAHFIEGFVHGALGSHESPVTALNRVARAAVEGPRGIRHPFSWAAYGVLLGCLPGEHASSPLRAASAVSAGDARPFAPKANPIPPGSRARGGDGPWLGHVP
jgi:CHAT domain-containing protein